MTIPSSIAFDEDERTMNAFVRTCWSNVLSDNQPGICKDVPIIQMTASDETVSYITRRLLRNVKLLGQNGSAMDDWLENASRFERNPTHVTDIRCRNRLVAYVERERYETRAMNRCIHRGHEVLHTLKENGIDTLRREWGITFEILHCIQRHAPSLSDDGAVFVAGMVQGMVETLLVAAVASQDEQGRLHRLDVSIESIRDTAMDDEAQAEDLIAFFL